MTPQELKNSILQLAMQGKLVEQRAEEGTAEDLYRQIQEEKLRLINEGKIKKQKALTEITEDEIPFDIPDSWKWVKGGEIYSLLDGVKTEGVEYPYLEAKYLRGKIESTMKKSGKYACKGTDVILVDGENSGEVFTLNEDGYMGSTFKVLHILESVFKPYILHFIAFHRMNLRNNKKGAAIPHLNKELFFGLLLPLPPLEEQKRIVAKIEELLPLIDKYEKAWTKLEEFNKKFPDDMQKSILQMAIQGKLVEQRKEEGNAEELYKQIQEEKQNLIKEGKIKKQKALPEIIEDEIPFDIPESWKWVRLGDCSSYAQSKPKIKAKDITAEMWSLDLEDIEKETGRIINFCKASERKITGEKVCFYKDQILYSKLRPYLKKILVAPNDGICTPELVPFKMYANLDNRYITYVLKSPHVDYVINTVTYGVKMPRVGTDTMVNLLIPLPPLEEQKRIVAKIEKILPIISLL